MSNRIISAALKCLRIMSMKHKRNTLTNDNFSIICNNCVGAVISHDMGKRFNSPTVNLYIPFPDYLYLIENLREIADGKIEDITGSSDFPVGLLAGRVHIYFLHYKSFDDACAKWHHRAARINYDNIYYILVEKDGCTHDMLKQFDSMNLAHKVALVHKKYDDVKCQAYIPGYEKDDELGNIIDYDGLSGRRKYDAFDWVKFLNEI